MNLFFSHWAQHLYIPKEVKSYFREHARIKTYTKGSIISDPFSGRGTWYYVYTGLVTGTYFNSNGDRRILWFAPENHIFTSTKHLFSASRVEYIQVINPCTLIEMDKSAAQRAQQLHHCVSELFHILNSRKMQQYRNLITILQEKNTAARYARFRDTMPCIADRITVLQTCEYLRISKGSHQSAKDAYLRRKN